MPLRRDGSGGTWSPSSPTPVPDVPERPSDYSELDGATGRDVYFRPERYPRSELGSVGVSVEVCMGVETFECSLHDVSQSGLALEWPRDVDVEVGSLLDRVVLRFDEHEAYRGSARVESVRRDEKATLVGASFTDTLMNIEDVLHLRDVKAWVAETPTRGLRFEEAPWRVDGQHRFKALVGELRLFLEDSQSTFGELEAVLPWHILHGEQASPGRDALIARVRAGFAADLVSVSGEIDVALRSVPAERRDAAREYSVRHLQALLMESPCMRRARHKPLGYAGDFEVMNFIYRGHFSGGTLFGKALNLAFVSTPAALAVRTRKDRIKERLAALITSPGRRSPVRILSIAAGPAQECFEVLQELEHIDVPVELVLFDQDKSALGYSYGRLERLVTARWREQVRLVYLHDSIKRLLCGAAMFEDAGPFDAIYANGLFDYLQPHTWVSLCGSLFGLLAPQGTLFVGNMVPQNPTRWVMELHLEWFLLYREPEQMFALAHKAAPEAELGLLQEESGINPFVTLTKA